MEANRMRSDAEGLRESVREACRAAATNPDGKHPFPVGAAFALRVGYPPEWLEQLPSESANFFAGVSNVSLWAPIQEGMLVVDLGCGAGLDSIIAAQRAGNRGLVVGFDFSGEMLQRTRAAATGAKSETLNSCAHQRNRFRDECFRRFRTREWDLQPEPAPARDLSGTRTDPKARGRGFRSRTDREHDLVEVRSRAGSRESQEPRMRVHYWRSLTGLDFACPESCARYETQGPRIQPWSRPNSA